jgi:hypothetical protein
MHHPRNASEWVWYNTALALYYYLHGEDAITCNAYVRAAIWWGHKAKREHLGMHGLPSYKEREQSYYKQHDDDN